MPKKGNGLGGTPEKIPRKGRPDTWGIRTPRHTDLTTGRQQFRYWIGREFKTKTAAEKALRDWFAEYEKEVKAAEDTREVQVRAPEEAASVGGNKPDAQPGLTVGQLLDRWLAKHQGEGTTKEGYEPKVRLHIKPLLGEALVVKVTDEGLDELYTQLQTKPCPTNDDKPLGPKTVRHIHNILSAAFDTITGPRKLLQYNPCKDASPPTERRIKAAEPNFPTLTDDQTSRFLSDIWTPCGNSKCDSGLTHHCLRDAPLWSVYVATGVRRSEALGMKWSLINWVEGSIELAWVVVEEGNFYRLRKLTKDGDDKAVIYVDQSVMDVLKRQRERQQYEKERLGAAWVDHDLVFARDGFKLHRGEAGGPQDPEKVSARWRTVRNRLHLPENFRLHDWRASRITNDLDAHENPVEVSANARHHSPGYTMARYGRRRNEGAKKLASASASRIGLTRVAA